MDTRNYIPKWQFDNQVHNCPFDGTFLDFVKGYSFVNKRDHSKVIRKGIWECHMCNRKFIRREGVK